MLRRSLAFCRAVSGTFPRRTFFGAFANAVDKLLVTLFNVLFLGLVSQFIYTLEYQEEPSHTIVHDEMTNFVTYVTFYASVVPRLRYCIRL